MAYDGALADRVRDVLEGQPGLVEQAMFGGLAFLVGGHLAVSAGGRGLLLRVDPAQEQQLLTDARTAPFEMRGRVVAGWLQVDVDSSTTDDELARWIGIGLRHARSLPPK